MLLALFALFPSSAPSSQSWSLVLGGDVMLNQISPKTRPLAAIAPFIREADLAVVNLEIPLTDQKAKTPFKSAEAVRKHQQFILQADPKHVGSLAGCGIDAVSLGNNHAMDYRAAGLAQMISLLDSKAIGHSGAGENEAAARAYVDLQNSRTPRVRFISFLGFKSTKGLGVCTPAKGDSAGVASLGFATIGKPEEKKIAAIVSEARKDTDFLIVAIHWGIERTVVPEPFQVALGRAFVDAGADVVVGHHPHVLQGIEIYKGKPILYSLGNLVSPRPSSTSVFRLSYSGATLSGISALPCRIANGKTTPLGAKQAQPALATIRGLCATLLRKFSNKNSKDPNISIAAVPANK